MRISLGRQPSPRFIRRKTAGTSFTPVDFVGLNVYMPRRYVVAADQQPGLKLDPAADRFHT